MRLRWRDCTIRLIVEGRILAGSARKLKSFGLSNGSDIDEVPVIGEDVEELEYKKGVYSFNFESDEIDSEWLNLAELIDQRDEGGALPPSVVILVTRPYRGPTIPSRTLALKEVVIKWDSMDGSADDFVGTKLSGKARRMDWR